VHVQDTFLTPDGGFRSPDLMVVSTAFGLDRLPDAALLIVEVAWSSQARDVRKAAVYAAAGVPDYWIVDAESDEVLVHREPRGTVYASVQRFEPGDRIAPLIDIPPVDVAALFAR